MTEANPVIAGALRIEEPVLHNSASILELDPLRIQTPAESWAYAVAFAVRRETFSAIRQDQSLVVEMDLEIEEGEVAIGALTEDLLEFVSSEAPLPSGSGRESIRITISDLDRFGWLMIRRGPSRGQPAIVRIHSWRTYAVPKERSPDLWEVEPPRTPNLLQSNREAPPLILSQPCAGETAATSLNRYLALLREQRALREAASLLSLPDEELKSVWLDRHREATTGMDFQLLYRDTLRNKRVLDAGSDLGFDGIAFARQGARVTFMSIVEENLEIVRRLCHIFQIENAGFLYLKTVESLSELIGEFDVLWCRGDLSCGPFNYMRTECKALARVLPAGSRWMEQTYSKQKWEREGCLPFGRWGGKTGQEGTPWMEWYDLKKWSERMRPAEFQAVVHFNFQDDDFCWFDMIRTN